MGYSEEIEIVSNNLSSGGENVDKNPGVSLPYYIQFLF